MLYAAAALALLAVVAVLVACYAAMNDQGGEAGMANAWLGLVAVLVFVVSSFGAIGVAVAAMFWRGYQ